jgi:hypothetical protein
MCACLTHFPIFIFFIFNDAICFWEDDLLELGQASKSSGGANTSNLMALASTLSLEDLVAKCSMDIFKLQEDVKVAEDRMKMMEER